MTILLIRHGMTRANEAHLYCGSTDLPLSERGKAGLRPVPGYEHFRFLSSGLRRANETLELLFPGKAYACVPELREVDFGSFEMKSYQELKQDQAYLAWITGDNEANVPPGGESGCAMRCRVLEAFDRIAAQGQDTVIVTHGGVIAAIMEHLFPEEGKNRYQWQCPNGSGYVLTGDTENWNYQPWTGSPKT